MSRKRPTCPPHLVCSMEPVKEPDVGAVVLVELEMVEVVHLIREEEGQVIAFGVIFNILIVRGVRLHAKYCILLL
jgi:hypothetical protein